MGGEAQVVPERADCRQQWEGCRKSALTNIFFWALFCSVLFSGPRAPVGALTRALVPISRLLVFYVRSDAEHPLQGGPITPPAISPLTACSASDAPQKNQSSTFPPFSSPLLFPASTVEAFFLISNQIHKGFLFELCPNLCRMLKQGSMLRSILTWRGYNGELALIF